MAFSFMDYSKVMALSIPTCTQHGLGHFIKTRLSGPEFSQDTCFKDMKVKPFD